MATSTLMNHRGAREVQRMELATIEAPSPTKTWYPIAHRAILDSVWSTLEGAGFQIRQSRLSVSHGDARFFGTLDLATPISDGVALAVGIRNSTDQSFPIGFCCGQRVFVCDNLAFTSEIVVSKKHTRFGQERYLEGLASAVGSLNQYRESAACWISQLREYMRSVKMQPIRTCCKRTNRGLLVCACCLWSCKNGDTRTVTSISREQPTRCSIASQMCWVGSDKRVSRPSRHSRRCD